MPWWESGGGRQRGEESSGLNDLVDGTSKKKTRGNEFRARRWHEIKNPALAKLSLMLS